MILYFVLALVVVIAVVVLVTQYLIGTVLVDDNPPLSDEPDWNVKR